MNVLLSTQCAEQALYSTTAVYHIVKATALHGEERVINEMARRERDQSGVSYGEAVTQAATRHKEIMTLCEKGKEYKALSEALSAESALTQLSLPA